MNNDVIQMALNAIKGYVNANFSARETSDALRAAFLEANGGSAKINPKTFCRGNALFEIVEEIIPAIIEEGLKDDGALLSLVDYKNIKDGDVNEFYVEDNSLFVVADAAAGIQGVRRQKVSGGETVVVKTTPKVVRVYEDLNRLLSGRIDFNTFVDRVAISYKQQILADQYKAINAIGANTKGLEPANVVTATYDEGKLLDLIQHIEAYTGKVARIYGTKAALRKVSTAVVADEAKSDMYAVGYFGKFNGTDMVALKQAHKVGTRTFALDDKKLFIIAGDDKPVKFVNEGEGLLMEKDAANNADLTKEYVYAQCYGIGVICAEQVGIYNIQ